MAVVAAGVLTLAPAYVSAQTAPAVTPQEVQDHQHDATEPSAHDHGATEAEAATAASGMMQRREQMMAHMHAMDAEVEVLIAKMTSAAGDAKMDAMAELVTVMARQRSIMRDQMMEMQSEMMGQMHQASGGSMSCCQTMPGGDASGGHQNIPHGR
jgi:hypothetical protein